MAHLPRSAWPTSSEYALWGIERDDLDVEYIVRYLVRRPLVT